MADINAHISNNESEEEEEEEEVVGGTGVLEDEEEDGQEEEESDDSMTASEDETSWISWFVSIRGNDFFCEVEEAFVQDDFNLTGLSSQVPYYDYALDMILDVDIPLESLTEEQHEIVETAAEVLYGLIHARYILTTAGMNKMYEKYQNVDFGRCPRSLCQGQPVLPVGLSDITREFSVEVFCPRCHETYHPRSSKHANLDGAYFGTTFCHLFMLTHPELVVLQPTEKYVPRIFGFRINESSQYYKLREPAAAAGGGGGGAPTNTSTSAASGGVAQQQQQAAGKRRAMTTNTNSSGAKVSSAAVNNQGNHSNNNGTSRGGVNGGAAAAASGGGSSAVVAAAMEGIKAAAVVGVSGGNSHNNSNSNNNNERMEIVSK